MLKPGLKRHQNNHPSKPDVVFVNFYCICIQMLFICFAFVCRIAQCHLYEMKSAQIHVFIAHILRIGFPMFFFLVFRRDQKFLVSHTSRYILYAFSGHRRPGDMVEWAERLGQRHTLDIVYDDSLCNLRDEGACHRWCRHLREGRFVAAVGAPPCETWSVARLRAWLAQDGGPAPVRTIDEPWGMKDNSLRLQRQVDCANDLMHTWMTFMALSLCSHTPFLMEHPAPSLKYVLAASIWRTEELGWFKLVKEVRETLIFQGRFGAVAAKPTHLLTFDLPFLPQALARWEDKQCDASRWIELKGKDSSGNFLTAQAKEYPPRLNAAIIDAIALGIVHAPLATQVLMPPPDESFLSDAGAVLMAQKVSGTERGPDYAPHQI